MVDSCSQSSSAAPPHKKAGCTSAVAWRIAGANASPPSKLPILEDRWDGKAAGGSAPSPTGLADTSPPSNTRCDEPHVGACDDGTCEREDGDCGTSCGRCRSTAPSMYCANRCCAAVADASAACVWAVACSTASCACCCKCSACCCSCTTCHTHTHTGAPNGNELSRHYCCVCNCMPGGGWGGGGIPLNLQSRARRHLLLCLGALLLRAGCSVLGPHDLVPLLQRNRSLRSVLGIDVNEGALDFIQLEGERSCDVCMRREKYLLSLELPRKPTGTTHRQPLPEGSPLAREMRACQWYASVRRLPAAALKVGRRGRRQIQWR